MGKEYEQLKPEERATVMLMRQDGFSLRAVARQLQRSPSSISREWARHRGEDQTYDAAVAGYRARSRRFQRRRQRKLTPGTVLFGVVEHFLREGWSPRKLPRQADSSKVETSGLHSLGKKAVGGRLPRDSWGRYVL